MPERTELNELADIRRDISVMKTMLTQVITYIRDAESEIPEKIRRFMNYMHDVHDIKFMYEETGHEVPDYVLREMERLHDRYRQILKEMHADDGVFGKVRAEMAKDPENRFDHTRLIAAPKKENGSEAGKS